MIAINLSEACRINRSLANRKRIRWIRSRKDYSLGATRGLQAILMVLRLVLK